MTVLTVLYLMRQTAEAGIQGEVLLANDVTWLWCSVLSEGNAVTETPPTTICAAVMYLFPYETQATYTENPPSF